MLLLKTKTDIVANQSADYITKEFKALETVHCKYTDRKLEIPQQLTNFTDLFKDQIILCKYHG